MGPLLTELLTLPTGIFTVLMAFCSLYWLFVIFGAVGVETLDFDLDGVLDGSIDGAVDGALDGAMEGAGAGVDADAGIDADGVGEAGGSHGIAWYIVHALALQKAPATVVFSVLTFWCWVISFCAMHFGAGGGLAGPTLALGSFGLAVALGVPLTNRTVRPLGRVFETQEAGKRQDAVGLQCEIRTGRVTETFGQAEVRDGGAGLLVEVRCATPNSLRRGDAALLVDYDPDAEAYAVEPMDALLGEPGDEPSLEDELSALEGATSTQPATVSHSVSETVPASISEPVSQTEPA